MKREEECREKGADEAALDGGLRLVCIAGHFIILLPAICTCMQSDCLYMCVYVCVTVCVTLRISMHSCIMDGQTFTMAPAMDFRTLPFAVHLRPEGAGEDGVRKGEQEDVGQKGGLPSDCRAWSLWCR